MVFVEVIAVRDRHGVRLKVDGDTEIRRLSDYDPYVDKRIVSDGQMVFKIVPDWQGGVKRLYVNDSVASDLARRQVTPENDVYIEDIDGK